MSSNSFQKNDDDSKRLDDSDPEESKPRVYKKPVAWLLGKQLIASLKGTLLYTAFGSKLDARDWMHAEEYPGADQAHANNTWQEYADKSWPESGTDYWKNKGEFWFDYISDTGDGMRATYSIAYLCYSNLWLEESLKKWQGNFKALPDKVGFMVRPRLPSEKLPKYGNAELNREQVDSDNQTELPRGAFLLVGGDTTYHLSDYDGLHTRFQTPFNWAFKDAEQDERLWKRDGVDWEQLRRPLFGIPGNHDYYDQLDGFRRQFRKPIKKDKEPPPGRELEGPQLMVNGFVRLQQASYIALRLPFDWLLWGLDTELGKVDERQRDFFRKINFQNGLNIEGQNEVSVKERVTPDKLIVATCAPTTVFGKYADRDDEKSAKAFFQLGLPRPFLNPEEVRKRREEKEAEAKKKQHLDPKGEHKPDEEEDPELKEHQCRLDISGDIHHYARYWGKRSGKNPRGRQAKNADFPQSERYASVVSGLGGAFHHPSTTYADQIREQVLYPSVDKSRSEIARRIFKPWKILFGGGVGVIGFLLAFLFYFAATVATSSRQAIDNLPPLTTLGITKETVIQSTVPKEIPKDVKRNPLTPWYWIFGATWVPENHDNRFIHFWGKDALRAPLDYWFGSALSIASLALIFLAFWPSKRIYKKYRKYEEVAKKARPKPGKDDEEEQGIAMASVKPTATERLVGTLQNTEDVASLAWYKGLMRQFLLLMLPLVGLSALMFLGGIFTLQPFKVFLTPFGNSLMMMLALVWATAAIVFSVRYSDWLSQLISKFPLKLRHRLLVWIPPIVGVLGVLCGFYIYGHNNTASDTLVDILVTLMAAAVFIGLTVLSAKKFGEVMKGQPVRWAYGTLGTVLGIFHALLQIIVPFLLVRKGTALTWLMAAGLIIAMQLFGYWLMKNNYRTILLGAWLFFGLAMLLLPYFTLYLSDELRGLWAFPSLESFQANSGYQLFRPDDTSLQETNLPWKLLGCGIAGFVGLLMSCIWLNWYLAVALLFHGHNNEAGGAGRIENFKQFIRFRLTEDDLTGFVIAVDKPQKDGFRLRPRIIDVIHLKRKTEKRNAEVT